MLKESTSTIAVNGRVEEFDAWNNPLQTLIADVQKRPNWVSELIDRSASWSDNSLRVLNERYTAANKKTNEKETIPEMYGRIAWTVSAGALSLSTEKRTRTALKFWRIMMEQKFMPNSPTQVNAGLDGKGCLSACFVVSPEDDMMSIMEVATEAAMIEKWGGGIGFNFSQLRPKNDQIATTHGQACGPIAVMKLYSQVGATLTQGSFRLGAHMATLDVWHPDIRAFIHCKDDDTSLQNFNISVGISEAFMSAVASNDEWNLVNPRDGGVVETINARDLWDEILESAWKTGDPGLVFVDTVAATAPNPHMGQCWPNPCGEQMLENHGSCNLGSINLAKYVEGEHIDWNALEEDIRTAVRFLDAVVEINQFPLEVLRDTNLRTRRIGLGVMGWADVMVMLGIAYDSDEALELADRIGEFFYETSVSESEILAEEMEPFLEWERSALKAKGYKPRRNSCLLSVAPTGTISRIADCGSGVEPFFANAWWSNVLWTDHEGTSQRLLDAPSAVWTALRERLNSEDAVREVLGQVADNPDDADRIYAEHDIDSSAFRTAMGISPEAHVRMQAAWQKWITNGVSKTVNLPNDATVADIEATYRLAFETGCKGVTVYRDGSKSMQVLETGKTDEVESEETAAPAPKVAARDSTLYGVTERVNTGHGKMYVTVNFDESNKPFELFTAIGKAGGSEPAHLEGLSRMISVILRLGISPDVIIEELNGITSEPVWDDDVLIRSAEDGIAHVLRTHANGMNQPLVVDALPEYMPLSSDNGAKPSALNGTGKGQFCGKCGNHNVVLQEGCLRCLSCGDSKCG